MTSNLEKQVDVLARRHCGCENCDPETGVTPDGGCIKGNLRRFAVELLEALDAQG